MKTRAEIIKRLNEVEDQISDLEMRYESQLELPVDQRDKRLMSFILSETQVFRLVKSYLDWVVEG